MSQCDINVTSGIRQGCDAPSNLFLLIQARVQGSGVVGRERMGTAFPHKKLSGNGVPTREILRYIFLLLLSN